MKHKNSVFFSFFLPLHQKVIKSTTVRYCLKILPQATASRYCSEQPLLRYLHFKQIVDKFRELNLHKAAIFFSLFIIYYLFHISYQVTNKSK